jgi:sugar lactone lactonase YvrE
VYALLGFLLPQAVQAQFSNGQDADFVIGQPNFTSSTANGGGISASTLNQPSQVVVDVANNKVYVADRANNRVLRFAYPITSNQPVAEAVLGQADFTSGSNAATQSGMYRPNALAIGPGGRLWVSDGSNHRILRFDAAHTKGNGALADGVLGQADFTSSGSATTQNGLALPIGVYEDVSGHLWVANFHNHRVLRYDNAASKANGAPADGILGQADFTSSGIATTQSGMDSPAGLTVDATGRLWVADGSNRRVLRYDNAASKANGAPADGVLGQADFTSKVSANTQTTFKNAFGVAVDNSGRLYVNMGERILSFDNAASKVNGAPADGVLGATDFTTDGSGVTRSLFTFGNYQSNISIVDGVLYVGANANNRVLVFGIASVATIPTVGEWAMIVLTLSLFCVAVMYVRKPSVAVGGEHIGSPVQQMPVQNLFLDKEDFVFSAKWFFPLSFIVTAIVWGICVYFHETAVRDMIGTALTGIVGGYLLQLFALWATEEKK